MKASRYTQKNRIEKIKLSACMIVKNEEKRVARCIQSYREIVDEIIVIDTGSSDKTKSVAKSLGAKIYDFEWIDDFAAAKNFGLEKCKGDWVIFLDADEYFPEGMAKNIPQLIKKYGKNGRKVILSKMINIDEDDGEIFCDISQARIFKNEKTLRYFGRIHEALKSEKENVEAVLVDETELQIIHTGYSKRIAIEKAQRNLDLLLHELEMENVDPKIYHYIATSYSTLKDYEKTIEFSKKFLETGANITGMMSKVYYVLIANMIEARVNKDEVYDVIIQAIEKLVENPMPYMYLGQWYYENGEYQKAIESFEQTIEKQNSYRDIEMNFAIGRVDQIYYMLGFLYEIKGNKEKAIEWYGLSLTENKKNETYLFALLRLSRDLDWRNIESIFTTVYNSELKEDMIFLNNAAVRMKHRKLLNYTANLLKEKFDYKDFTWAFLLLLNQEYVLAFKHFYEAYELTDESNYLLWSFIISENLGDKNMNEMVRQKASGFLKKYIEYRNNSKKKEMEITEADIVDLKFYFVELLLLGDEKSIDVFLSMIGDNSIFKEFIVMELFQEKKYVILINYLKNRAETSEEYFVLGQSLFFQKDYSEAKSVFEKLENKNYMENKVNQYLDWIDKVDNTSNKENRITNKEMTLINSDNWLEQEQWIKENIEKYLELKNFKVARKLIDECENKMRNKAEFYSMKGIIELYESNVNQARKYFLKGLDYDLFNFDLNYNLCYLYQQGQNYDLARAYGVLAINLTDEEAKLQIIDSLLRELGVEIGVKENVLSKTLIELIAKGIHSVEKF